MTLHLRAHPAGPAASFGRDRTVSIGRGRDNDVRVGHERVRGRWTVSRQHAEIRWDGDRWSTVNVSGRHGLMHVYEPGYEEVPLEPGRPWVPVRHRWCLSVGGPDHRFHVVCTTDEHDRRPAVAATEQRVAVRADDDEDATAEFLGLATLHLTSLEHDVALAYYSDFAALPRPPVLEPRSHDDAARCAGRSRDSTRKAIERLNEKIARSGNGPPVASGRNVSSEIGRWLARAGAIDPE